MWQLLRSFRTRTILRCVDSPRLFPITSPCAPPHHHTTTTTASRFGSSVVLNSTELGSALWPRIFLRESISASLVVVLSRTHPLSLFLFSAGALHRSHSALLRNLLVSLTVRNIQDRSFRSVLKRGGWCACPALQRFVLRNIEISMRIRMTKLLRTVCSTETAGLSKQQNCTLVDSQVFKSIDTTSLLS